MKNRRTLTLPKDLFINENKVFATGTVSLGNRNFNCFYTPEWRRQWLQHKTTFFLKKN
jgi:hypothetical protein